MGAARPLRPARVRRAPAPTDERLIVDDHLRDGVRRLGDLPTGRRLRPLRATGERPGRRGAGRAVVAVVGTLTAAGLLVGCTADDATPSASPTPTASATSTPEPSPTPSEVPEPTATPEPAPTEAVPPVPPATPADPSAPPPAAEGVHGATAWGVYLAIMTSEDDPAWVGSGTRLEALGYEPTYGDISCDQGATETLGLPENVLVRSVHFATREDADRFVTLYGPDILGIAQVTTLCLD
jgi:hypothetical protein